MVLILFSVKHDNFSRPWWATIQGVDILNCLTIISLENLDKNISFKGSDYGGWSFLDNNYLNNKYIISGGLGEDASFDVELISKYNCKILVVDPTPGQLNIMMKSSITKERPNQNLM